MNDAGRVRASMGYSNGDRDGSEASFALCDGKVAKSRPRDEVVFRIGVSEG